MRTDELTTQHALLALQKENAVLMRELAKVQQRLTALLTAKGRELEQLQAQLTQASRQAMLGL
jgi:phage shock protein A